MMNLFIHPLADVQSETIGEGTKIWQFCVVLPKAKIGRDCNICSHCFIENDVVVGDRVTVKCGVQLWDGLRIEDDMSIRPNVTFTNDIFPCSKQYPVEFSKTIINAGASIGGGSTASWNNGGSTRNGWCRCYCNRRCSGGVNSSRQPGANCCLRGVQS